MKKFKFTEDDFDTQEDLLEEDDLFKSNNFLAESLRAEAVESFKRHHNGVIPSKNEMKEINQTISVSVKESLGIITGYEDSLERELNQEIFEWIRS